ncbi:MAG: ATP-binding protein [Paracoccus denitrificans]|uniref:ATP-binding protein n=1 Tax=Paracoccus denitrificans TaxID=266 RepID=A0A533I639_PARDE|nr:MAG: ATP-binding protein [Paracoccus denitrificans]
MSRNMPSAQMKELVKQVQRTLAGEDNQVQVAEIKHHDGQLLIPNGMSVDAAIELLERRRDYLEEEVVVTQAFPVFPYDGANALAICLEDMFGWAAAEGTPGFFGKTPPRMITIEVGPGLTRKIPWGRFSLPGVEGFLQTSVERKHGRIVFVCHSVVKRNSEATVQALYDRIGAYLNENSIYAGQAIKIRFRDDDGNMLEMPEPTFLPVEHISRDMLVYSKDVQDAIETNLFTPIERLADCKANDIPVKRGVLLGGPYGTGKTMAATVASRLAVDNGVTYLYVPHCDELADAIEFAKQYERSACVIFCEDIDRAITGERTVKMDDILNILDGIDTKGAQIITVLTTNHLEDINPAMLRPGRLDAVIDVTAPDAEAVERLVRLYGKGSVAEETDLTEVGQILQGTIPAVIAEVVKRAKLAQLRLQERGTVVEAISAEALVISAKSMQSQVDLLAKLSNQQKPEPTFAETLGTALAPTVERILNDKLATSVKQIGEIHQAAC